jgi:hypothetical protein
MMQQEDVPHPRQMLELSSQPSQLPEPDATQTSILYNLPEPAMVVHACNLRLGGLLVPDQSVYIMRPILKK